MRLADLQLPVRLLAGGGPSSPDPRVLRALTTPVIGQFDPDFTGVMDDVVQLARATFLTASPHCFAVSASASGGLEAVLNTLLEAGDGVAIGTSGAFAESTAEMVRRLGGSVVTTEQDARYLVLACVDPSTGVLQDVEARAARAHSQGSSVIVEATASLAARALRVDDWGIDVCVAGADHAVGAPSGMSLVTYSPEIAARLQQRTRPPTTSYLDLIQLQAYWSPERLNHHTAPTSLVYGLREALRLVQLEGLAERWRRHADTAAALRTGLAHLGLEVGGDPPFAFIQVQDEAAKRTRLLDEFGIHVTRTAPTTWRLGLLGADARPEIAHHVLNALEKVLAA